MKKIKKQTGIDRNRPCHCGSGKKYKICCLGTDQTKRAKHLEDNAHTGLANELNQDMIGGGRPTFSGALFWAALRSSGGKSIPVLPKEAISNPIVIRTASELKKRKKNRPK